MFSPEVALATLDMMAASSPTGAPPPPVSPRSDDLDHHGAQRAWSWTLFSAFLTVAAILMLLGIAAWIIVRAIRHRRQQELEDAEQEEDRRMRIEQREHAVALAIGKLPIASWVTTLDDEDGSFKRLQKQLEAAAADGNPDNNMGHTPPILIRSQRASRESRASKELEAAFGDSAVLGDFSRTPPMRAGAGMQGKVPALSLVPEQVVVLNGSPLSPRRHSRTIGHESEQAKADVLVSDDTCAVCMCDFRDGDELRMLPCGHTNFHLACIDRWLLHATRSGQLPTCPMCNQPPFKVRYVDDQVRLSPDVGPTHSDGTPLLTRWLGRLLGPPPVLARSAEPASASSGESA